MNVKLQIKEVREERRRLSDFEWYAYFAGQRIVEPLIYLDKVGLILQSVDTFERVGTFRTETIRNPTVDEAIAWYSIQAYNACSARVKWCSECPRYDTDDRCTVLWDYYRAVKVLENKEVIVEVVK